MGDGTQCEPGWLNDRVYRFLISPIKISTLLCLPTAGAPSPKLTETNKDYAPFWSPDGNWILFTSERDGNKEIYIMDAQGQQVTNLTNRSRR